ncbi:MAG: osmoprotectant transport system ATP-binding protein [Erysipelotrichaceae bacterium]|nr:MAG: osmoprotectant transport system ATP-binding protein [Erysipelotrichaceae bacterium]
MIGPSGCGKSTLLRSINRLVDLDEGEILVNGQNISNYKAEDLRRQLGYCIQGVGLFPHLSVYDNIAIVPQLLKWDKTRIIDRIDTLMDLTGLPKTYLTKKPHELSGGEAQRVGVCRALAADPSILLMDEPFGAVDPMTREQIQLAFRKIQHELKKTVLFVTHDMEEAILLADRIAIMHKGKILSLQTPGGLVKGKQDAFVNEFIGADYPLRLLKRYTLSDLEVIKVDQDSSKIPLSSLNEFSTTKEILSEILQSGSQEIMIQKQDKSKVIITYDALIELLRKVLNNEIV